MSESASANENQPFPNWIPPSVIESLREYEKQREGYGWDDEHIEMLRRLMRHPGMKVVWEFLASASKVQNVIEHPDLFSTVAFRGYMGPIGDEKRTPKEAKKWQADVIKTAWELANLVRTSELNNYIWQRQQEARLRFILSRAMADGFTGKVSDPRLPEYLMDRASLSELLEEFAVAVPTLVKPMQLKRPGGPEAKRAYFVRQLTGYFRAYFKGPRREFVAIATAAAFDDPRVSKRQIQRLAP